MTLWTMTTSAAVNADDFNQPPLTPRWQLWHWQRHCRCHGNERRSRRYRLQGPREIRESREGDQVQESQPERLLHGAGPGQLAVGKKLLQVLSSEREEARHPHQ